MLLAPLGDILSKRAEQMFFVIALVFIFSEIGEWIVYITKTSPFKESCDAMGSTAYSNGK